MANVFFSPFNFDPDSVEVKTNTSNEAVPNGKYAYVVAECLQGGSFIIDDDVALQVPAAASTFQTAWPSTGTLYTNSTNKTQNILISMVLLSGSGSLFIGNSNGDQVATVADNTRVSFLLAPGQSVHLTNTTMVGTYSISGQFATDQTSQQFWVPTGTNLRVSGSAKYTLTLFNSIT